MQLIGTNKGNLSNNSTPVFLVSFHRAPRNLSVWHRSPGKLAS